MKSATSKEKLSFSYVLVFVLCPNRDTLLLNPIFRQLEKSPVPKRNVIGSAGVGISLENTFASLNCICIQTGTLSNNRSLIPSQISSFLGPKN